MNAFFGTPNSTGDSASPYSCAAYTCTYYCSQICSYASGTDGEGSCNGCHNTCLISCNMGDCGSTCVRKAANV